MHLNIYSIYSSFTLIYRVDPTAGHYSGWMIAEVQTSRP